MSGSRTVVFCGLDEREEALLRLLLKRIQGRLREAWVVGDDEEQADALLVDPETIAGNVAIATAKRRGVPYLVLSSRPRPGEELWTIHRPPLPEDVARVFNNIPLREVEALPVISATTENFYDLDLEAGDTAAPPPLQPLAPRATGAIAPEDAEALFKRDPLSTSVAVLKTVRLPGDLAVEEVRSPSSRRALRAAESGLKSGAEEGEGALPIGGASERGEDFLLVQALQGGILFAPCECRRSDGPRFALVPKTCEVLTPAPLSAFRAFRDLRFTRADFLTLTSQRLADLRRVWPAVGNREVALVCLLGDANQSLHPSLDPGGRFWLEGELSLDASLPDEGAIIAAMRSPARLHEIAQRSGQAMARVIAVVNALHGLGVLGSALRDRLR